MQDFGRKVKLSSFYLLTISFIIVNVIKHKKLKLFDNNPFNVYNIVNKVNTRSEEFWIIK